jgi:hypothetical protein
MRKNLWKKPHFIYLILLILLCCVVFSVLDYSIRFFGESTEKENFHVNPISFRATTTNYSYTHPKLVFMKVLSFPYWDLYFVG